MILEALVESPDLKSWRSAINEASFQLVIWLCAHTNTPKVFRRIYWCILYRKTKHENLLSLCSPRILFQASNSKSWVMLLMPGSCSTL